MLITISLLLSLFFCSFCSCIDTSIPEKTPIIKIEQWKLIETGTDNFADITINTHQNGSLSCEGVWYYNYTGFNITSKNLNGSVYKDSDYVSISCSGTAYCSEECASEKSLYTLSFTGHSKNEMFSGIWEISFREPYWAEKAPRRGKFEGYLTYTRGNTP